MEQQQQDPKRKKNKTFATVAEGEACSKSKRDTDCLTQSCSSDMSSSSVNTAAAKEESMEESFEGFPEIDESFWSDALSINSLNHFEESMSLLSGDGDDMSFWLKVFMESGDSLELPDI